MDKVLSLLTKKNSLTRGYILDVLSLGIIMLYIDAYGGPEWDSTRIGLVTIGVFLLTVTYRIVRFIDNTAQRILAKNEIKDNDDES